MGNNKISNSHSKPRKSWHSPTATNRIRPIRNAARAIIIENGKLLTIKMKDYRGEFFILPGGGQQPGETLTETVTRECLEELGAKVEPGPLVYVREYIGKNHDFKKSHKSFHQVEAVFYCHLLPNQEVGNGQEEDKYQTGISWLSLKNFADYRFYPQELKPYFIEKGFTHPHIYLGDIN